MTTALKIRIYSAEFADDVRQKERQRYVFTQTPNRTRQRAGAVL